MNLTFSFLFVFTFYNKEAIRPLEYLYQCGKDTSPKLESNYKC